MYLWNWSHGIPLIVKSVVEEITSTVVRLSKIGSWLTIIHPLPNSDCWLVAMHLGYCSVYDTDTKRFTAARQEPQPQSRTTATTMPSSGWLPVSTKCLDFGVLGVFEVGESVRRWNSLIDLFTLPIIWGKEKKVSHQRGMWVLCVHGWFGGKITKIGWSATRQTRPTIKHSCFSPGNCCKVTVVIF